jgi:5-formyltetrahydrofolate cyclo-ligase
VYSAAPRANQQVREPASRFAALQEHGGRRLLAVRANSIPLLIRRLRRAARAALPEVVRKGEPLQFREWWPGAPMASGVYDLPVPQGTELLVPQALLIPPGFDAQGYRRLQAAAALHPAPLKIGVAFELSRMPTIRPQPHDIAMDFIVTEAGVYRVGPTGITLVDSSWHWT